MCEKYDYENLAVLIIPHQNPGGADILYINSRVLDVHREGAPRSI